MPYDSKLAMASYIRKAEGVAADHMLPCNTMFFEGRSDARFYEALCSVRCRYMGEFVSGRGASMKESLLDSYRHHMKTGQAIDKSTRCYYCVDRDFDEVLGCNKESNERGRLFYQLAKTGRVGGFNDLENMLLKSPLFERLMLKVYRMSPERTQQVVKNVQEAASVVGCFRVANRYMKGENAWDILYQIDRYGDRKEVGAYFLLSRGIAKVDNGKIVVDVSRLAKELRNHCGPNDRLVADTIQYALDLWAKVKRTCNFQDYCRGHDLTEFLCELLCSREGYPHPFDSENLEQQMRKIPYSDYNVLDECRLFIEKYELGKEISRWKKSKF